MPQKALTSKGKRPAKLGKKAPRVNSNGKKAIQKKGKFVFKPKVAVAAARASHEMTREVNLKNELEAARRATQSGGKMLVVKPPPDAEVEIRGPKPKKNPKQAPVVKVPYRF
jgi:hypothetical protein